MLILPVLDLKGGRVVRGVRGQRQQYRPVVSRLTRSSLPVDVAQAFRDGFGFSELYVADLDAIAGAEPAWQTYAALQALGCRLWVDAGLRQPAMALPLAAAGIERLVVGLETISGPAALASLCRQYGGDRIVFSLDLKEARPLGDLSTWDAPDARSIAGQAIGVGVQSIIVLDLAQVGTGAGTGTELLCRQIAGAFPETCLLAGGGVRDVGDLQRLQSCGVRGVLLASALHDGSLNPEDLV